MKKKAMNSDDNLNESEVNTDNPGERTAELDSGHEPIVAADADSDSLTSLRAQLQQAEDRCARSQAELQNFRNRTRREMEDREKFASLPLMRDLLQVVDNLDLAIQSAEDSGESSGLLAGVQMVAEQLKTVLANHHCTSIDSQGKPFDPNLHEAVQMQPDEEIPANHVSRETRAGYMLHDRVIRPSQVFVSTGSSK